MKRFAFLLSLIFCLNAAYAFTLDGIVYSDSISSNTVFVTGYTSDLPADVVIPSEVTYEGTAYPVAAIDSIAFKDCTSLTSIEIPACITRIAGTAFLGCTSLASVVISDGNDVLTIDGNYLIIYEDGTPCVEHVSLFVSNPLKDIYVGRNLSYDNYSPPFSNKTELSKLTIGNRVTEIGRSAFSGCTSLSEVEIPDNVTVVGDYSFYGCKSLTSVVLPDSISKIGKYAFAHCSSLTSIKIPDSITTIESFLFGECTSLASIVVPKNVTTIIGSAFWGCTSLTSVTVSDGTDILTILGKNSSTDDDYPFVDESKYQLFNGNPLAEVYLGRNLSYDSTFSPFMDKKDLTKVTIGNMVTEIGDSAFSGCASLASIEFPDSIITIGKYAFSGCSSLSSIVVPNNVMEIGEEAFSHCSALTNVDISDGEDALTIKGDYPTFYGSPLKEVYSGRNFSNGSSQSPFRWQKDLYKVTIGKSVTEIGDYAFSDCSSLEIIEMPDSITKIGEYAFYDCKWLMSVKIPSSVITIGKEAFSGCSVLTSIDIPNMIMTIGDDTFKGCTSLISVNISESTDTLTISGNECSLFGDSPLKKVSLGRNLSYSSTHSPFRDRDKLSKVTISGTVTELGDSFFAGCKTLAAIAIPNSVTRIGNSAFAGCNALTSIAIPESVNEIGNSLFSGCKALASIIIPDGVTRIGDSAFSGCSSIKSINIPENVLIIDESAFSGCASLASIAIPGSIAKIGKSSFSDCKSLKSVTISDGDRALEFGSLVFNRTALNEVYLGRNISYDDPLNSPFRAQKELSKVTIGNSVTSIGSSMFEGCSSLISVEIPNSVVEMGSAVFSNCTSLTSVVISDGITKIEISTFSGCTSLASIKIPDNILEICKLAFFRCISLISVSIPNSVTTIGNSAFSSCTSLESVEMPNSINKIESSAFSNCTSLRSISIPESVMDIGRVAFSGCISLTSIVISDSEGILTIDGQNSSLFELCPLEEIYLGRNLSYDAKYSPFHNQNKLSKVTIGEDVTELAPNAFHGCENLRTIVAYNDLNISSTAFEKEVLHKANMVINGNKDLALGISESQWNRFSHVYYEEGSKQYLPILWNSKLDCPEAFYTDDNGCLVSTECLTATVYDNSDSNIAVYLKGDNIFDSIVSEKGYRFSPSSVWEDNTFYLVSKDNSGNSRNIFVQESGKLSDAIGVENLQSVKVLTVSGDLNGTDIAAINNMTSLRFLDMRQANIVEGGEAYCGNLKTENNVFGDDFFRNMKNLSTIILPESVKSIGSCAVNVSIKLVIIPDGIIEIGNSAFSDCSYLTSIKIPQSMTDIRESAFGGCLSLTSVIILDGNKDLYIRGTAFDDCKLNEVYLGRNLGYDYDYYIESPFRFKNCLLKVTIGSNVKRIKYSAFEGCSSLTSITMPDGLEIIGDKAFAQCTSLASLELSNHIVQIGDEAFYGCTSLSSIELPASLVEIGWDTFSKCTSLSSIELPAGLVEIGGNVFSGCTALASIKLPRGITTIKSWMFEDCISLKAIELPGNIISIEDGAFSKCKALESIVIPNSVAKIERYAFARCESLKKIKLFRLIPPSIDETTFMSVDKSKCQLIVPKGSLEKYRKDQYWKEFLNISDDLVVLDTLPEMRYGDAGIDLAEYAPEGVALAYESSDNNIARIDGNKLTICGVGEVMVSASLVEEDTQLELIDPVRTFVVKKADLTATAQSYEIKQGEPMPEFAIIYDGFVYDDNVGSLRELPVISCVAKDTSEPGEYEILLSGGYDLNYNIKTVNGLLTIKPVSGISDIEGDVKPFSCIVTDGQIIISGLTTSQAVAIYDANGRMCYRANAAEDGTLTYRPDTAGVYIVRSGSQTVKVIVR